MNIGIECDEISDKCMKIIKKLKVNALQIYLGDKISTTLTSKPKYNTEELKNIKFFLKNNNIKLYIHTSLRLNLVNPLTEKYQWIVKNVIHDLNYSIKLNGKGVVVHLGSRKTKYFELTEKQA